MKILELKLRGFIGIREGMGLDMINLDFSDLAGLIAFAGPNGKGKTTILENLHPYRTLVSRSGALQHHVYLRDSYKDLTFVHNGTIYRCLVQIDSHTGKQDCFIYVNSSTDSVVDGKTGEYDRYVENLFGSQRLYFNSVFCAQGSDKLNDMTTGDLKALFSEFLQLDKLVAWEQTAKSIRNAGQVKIDGLTSKIDALNDRIDTQETDYKIEIEQWNTRLKTLEDEAKLLASRGARIEKKVIELGRQEEVNQAIRDQIDTLRKSANEKQMAFDEWHESYLENQADRDELVQEIKKDLITAQTIIETEPALLARRATLKALKQQADQTRKELDDAKDDLRETTVEIMGLQTQDIEDVSKFNTVMAKIDREIARVKDDRSACAVEMLELDNQITAAEGDTWILEMSKEIDHCREKVKVLEDRDPSCQSKTCSFIVDALKAQEALKLLEPEFKGLLSKNQKLIVSLAAKQSRLHDRKACMSQDLEGVMCEKQVLQEEIDDTALKQEKAMDRLRGKRSFLETHIKALDAKLETIDGAEQKQTEIENKLTEIAQLKKTATRCEADLIKLRGEVRKASEELTGKKVRLNAAIEQIQEDIEDAEEKIVTDADRTIEKLKAERVEIDDRIPENEKERKAVGEKITELKAAESQVGELKDRMAKLRKARIQIQDIISEWEYLRFACSKDGLRALEIDSVAPTLSKDANDLLFGAFGPQDHVKLRTQDPETGREVLDILIEQAGGTEVLLDNRSGGQKVWYLKALRLALTLMSKHKTGRNILTAMVDEEDGALDEDNAARFIGMYRSFMNSGEFEDCFYISHKPGCVALADHVVTFAYGGVTIQ